MAARAQGWSTGVGWEIASKKALTGKIGSIRISQIVIPQGPNIVSSSTNYNPGESGLAAYSARVVLESGLGSQQGKGRAAGRPGLWSLGILERRSLRVIQTLGEEELSKV